jgi:hypothetical protein
MKCDVENAIESNLVSFSYPNRTARENGMDGDVLSNFQLALIPIEGFPAWICAARMSCARIG